MKQILVNLRVRPARIVVLINRTAATTEFVRVVRFLSQIWGGRYFPVIPVDAEQPDELTSFRLRHLRPDFVYGVNINEQHWSQCTDKACQPRQYCLLTEAVAEDVRRAQVEQFIHVDRPLIAMFEARNTRSPLNRPLKVVSADATNPLAPYLAAVLGIHHPALKGEYQDEGTTFESDDVAEFISLTTEFVEDWKLCWLDVTGYRLEPHHVMTPPVEPTIVLVKKPTVDLAYFWNLRLASSTLHLPWIIPIPIHQAMDGPVVAAVAKWLKAFLKYGDKPNYCVVTSQSVSEEECTECAAVLCRELRDSPFEAVDFEPPKNRLPLVLPFEHSTVWPAQMERQRLTFTAPVPKTFRGLGSSESWFVDILGEAGSSRAVKDAQFPESTIIPDLLNGPCPPQFTQSRIRQFGDGVDSINVRCTSSKEVVKLHIPLADEVFEELLREHGFEVVPDEKRSVYLPTIRRFGGLHHAASALSGQSGQVLEILRCGRIAGVPSLRTRSTSSSPPDPTGEAPSPSPHATASLPPVPKPLRLDQIKNIGRFGRGQLSDSHYMDQIDHMFRNQSERVTRIGKKRFREYAGREVPDEMTLNALLEHWADKSVLRRRWEIGPCSTCRQTSFVAAIDLQKPILCPHCGDRVSIKADTRIGYTLRKSVRHSLNEGIAPVVLTGRFLRNLTDRGFFWLPGIKYSKGDTRGDIDLVACCDGHVVFAECKTRPGGETLWKQITDQFLENASVAIACEISVVVLAAQVNAFPDSVEQQIQSELNGKIPYLLLNNDDLEKGNRRIPREDAFPWLRLHDLLPNRFPEPEAPVRSGSRQIDLGWAVYTKQPKKEIKPEE